MRALQAHLPVEPSIATPAPPRRRPRPPEPAAGRRDEEVIALCEAMIDVAAALFNVCSKEMRRSGRTALAVARFRQITMYVTHTVLGLSMADVGKGFQRDRTTVLHACHLIEDMRDDGDFDTIVCTLERVATAAFGKRVGR